MLSRRGGRWVFWPARLLWIPVLAAGLWFLTGMEVATSKVDGDTWRVLYTLSAPDAWFDPMWRGLLGAALLVGGLVLTFAHFWEPGPYGAFAAVQYRVFSWASMIFGLLAFLAAFAFSGHVVETGAAGMDWRFLVTRRSQPLDEVLLAVSAVGAVVSYFASWGLRMPGWSRRDTAPASD